MSDRLLNQSTADDTFFSFSDSSASTLRFANNQVVQHVAIREPSLTVRAAFGKKVGSATTNRFDQESLTRTLHRAESLARLAPEDREYLPPLPPQRYADISSFALTTAEASPNSIARRAKPVVQRCRDQGLMGAGIVTGTVGVRGLAASSGLFAYEDSTDARFSLTATRTSKSGYSEQDSSGWCYNAHRDINHLNIRDRSRIAIEKAVASENPGLVEAGHWPVILEPAAVAGIFGPFLGHLRAKSYFRGNSALSDKLDERIFDERLNIVSDPDHTDLMGSAFDGQGLPTTPQTWVRQGTLKTLSVDRFTGQERDLVPNTGPDAIIMNFAGPRAASIEDIIAKTDKAVLITNFWYIRDVNRKDITVTGMTRDGTFLVENGRIVKGLRNFRFHESPLRAFAKIDLATQPFEAITLERNKMLLPAVRLPAFHLSSVTKF
jgi:predicted Zn-dependent protease